MTVPAAAGDVDVLVVEKHPGVGALGRGLARAWLLLRERAGWSCVPVNFLIQPAIELQRLSEPDRSHRYSPLGIAPEGGVRVRSLRGRGRSQGRKSQGSQSNGIRRC